MKRILLILFVFMLAICSVSADYALRRFDLRAGRDSQIIELAIIPEKGRDFESICRMLPLSDYPRWSVRILGSFPEQAQEELMAFYRKTMPEALAAAMKSSGNLHNPALSPLQAAFPEALKATGPFQDIQKALDARGYSVDAIEFEKFHIFKGKVAVPDIWLKVVKKPE